MTPEEKQVIIDKALELGFKKLDWLQFYGFYFYSYKIKEGERLVIEEHPTRMCLNIVYKGKRDKLFGELENKEHLETLFNAITS